MKLTIEGKDWERFHGCLDRLTKFNFSGLHKEVGEYIIDSTKERFRKGQAPDGSTWPVSRRAKEDGGKTMMMTRRLYNSLTYQADASKVVVGTNAKYAATHQPENEKQQETVIKPKKAKLLKFRLGGKWVSKRSVTIPARRFLGINDDDAEEIVQIGLDRIEEATRKS